jgi:hypothetical protein
MCANTLCLHDVIRTLAYKWAPAWEDVVPGEWQVWQARSFIDMSTVTEPLAFMTFPGAICITEPGRLHAPMLPATREVSPGYALARDAAIARLPPPADLPPDATILSLYFYKEEPVRQSPSIAKPTYNRVTQDVDVPGPSNTLPTHHYPGTADARHAPRRRSPSVGSDTQDTTRMSDSATAALQSDEDIQVIVSLLNHVSQGRKDLGCGFRRLLVYFIVYFWFLELKGVGLSLCKDPIYDVGSKEHRTSLTSADILEYLDQFVHPLQGFTARLQNGNFITPGRTVIRRLRSHWENMGTRLQSLQDDDRAKWRALDYIFGSSLPPLRMSDEAKNLGPLSHKIIYTVDWQNLMRCLSAPGLNLPMS